MLIVGSVELLVVCTLLDANGKQLEVNIPLVRLSGLTLTPDDVKCVGCVTVSCG